MITVIVSSMLRETNHTLNTSIHAVAMLHLTNKKNLEGEEEKNILIVCNKCTILLFLLLTEPYKV